MSQYGHWLVLKLLKYGDHSDRQAVSRRLRNFILVYLLFPLTWKLAVAGFEYLFFIQIASELMGNLRKLSLHAFGAKVLIFSSCLFIYTGLSS